MLDKSLSPFFRLYKSLMYPPVFRTFLGHPLKPLILLNFVLILGVPK